jgi:type I restriction enzyme, S subunit
MSGNNGKRESDPWTHGRLPENWAITSFEHLCDVVRGGSPRPMGDPKFFGGDIPFLKIADVTASDGMTVRKTETTVTEEGAARSRLIQAGRLILTNSATVCVPVFIGMDSCIHDGFLAFDNLPKSIDQKYLYYFFKYVRPFVLNKHKQGVTQVNLNTGIVSEMSLLLAPSREQRRIVAKVEELFSELDKGIEALTTSRKQLKAYRQSVLKHAFEGKLTEQWREGLDKTTAKRKDIVEAQIPDELARHCADCWPWCRLGDVSEVTGGLTKNPRRSALPLMMKYLRVANVYADRLELENVAEIGVTEDENENIRLRRGDLLVVEGNGSVEQIGRVAMWGDELEDVGHQNHLIRVRLVPGMSPRFFLLFLMSPLGRDLIVRQASSTSGLHTLSISKVSGLPVPVPSPREQEALVNALAAPMSEIDKQAEEIEIGLAKCSALRQSILKKAFSGQLVAQDSQDEPASALLQRIREERNGMSAEKSRNGKDGQISKNGKKKAA